MLAKAVLRMGDTGQCASKDAVPRKRVNWGKVPHQLKKGTNASKDIGSRKEWIVRSYIGCEGERNILYKGVETFL